MRCHEDVDPAAFAERVWPFLSTDPVSTNVIATVAELAATGAMAPSPGSRWLRIHHDDRLVGAAIWIPPRGVGLSPMPAAAAEALADHLAIGHLATGDRAAESRATGSRATGSRATDSRPLPAGDGSIHPASVNDPPSVNGPASVDGPPSVDGPAEAAGAFARRYASVTGRTPVPGTAQRLFRLDRVLAPTGVPGRPRPARPADRPLILDWLARFREDTQPGRPPVDDGAQVDRRLAAGPPMWFWEVDREPVSFAWRTGISTVPGRRTTVCRISAVYTPPGHRGNGYASANVAAISQDALDGGALACMLYTERSNPTSNKIYQAIGYRPVGEAQEWHLR
jgi:RimJ/RimL family protein N-acetyltransferase